MSREQYIRFGGVALQISGVFLGLALLFHPDEVAADFVPGSYWTVIHVALGIGFLFLASGFATLVLKFEGAMGSAAASAVLLFSALSGLVSGLMIYFEGFIMPALAHNADFAPALDPIGPILSGGFGVALMTSMILYSFAAVVVGLMLLKLLRKQKYIGLCFLATPLAAFTPPLPHIIGTLGGLVFGFGCLMLGRYVVRPAS